LVRQESKTVFLRVCVCVDARARTYTHTHTHIIMYRILLIFCTCYFQYLYCIFYSFMFQKIGVKLDVAYARRGGTFNVVVIS